MSLIRFSTALVAALFFCSSCSSDFTCRDSLNDIEGIRINNTENYNTGITKHGKEIYLKSNSPLVDSVRVLVKYPDNIEEKIVFEKNCFSKFTLKNGYRVKSIQELRVTSFSSPNRLGKQIIERQSITLGVYLQTIPNQVL